MSVETMYILIMLSVFLAAVLLLKLPVGLSLAVTSAATALAAGQGLPLRHLIEGMFGYIDVSLVLLTAMIFMKIIERNGLLQALSRDLIITFGHSPVMLLSVMTLIIMFPGMITGSCTASVLSTGVLLAPVLKRMEMPDHIAGAMIAMAAVYGMIAPPINIMVMIIGGGIDMPYIGFDIPLLVTALPLAILSTLWLGYRYARQADLPAIIESFRNTETPGCQSLYLPLVIVIILMIGPKALPTLFPDLRLPLTFLIGSGLSLMVGKKVPVFASARLAISEILPVIGILFGVGMLIQIMTLTGIRGQIAVSSLSLPPELLLLSIAVMLPLFGGISVFGAASILGVPFILAFLSQDLIITAVGLSLVAAMGSFVPPVALTAVIAAQVVGETNYLRIVKPLILPSLVAIAVGILMIKFATLIAKFLVF